MAFTESMRGKNIIYRLIWSIGHTPLRFVEFVQFGLIGWVLIQTIVGFGGFLPYGEPMIGVSKSLLLLCLVHAIMLVLRKDRPGMDWILLVPIPFLIYAWIQFRFISPYTWNAGALFSVYLQCYALYLIIYNSIHGVHSAKWMLGLLQVPVLLGVAVAFLSFYLFPIWIQDVTRVPDPAYSYGAGGFLQDPANTGNLILALLPLTILFIYKQRFNGPVLIYSCMVVGILVIGLVMSANLWGFVTLGLLLLVVPFFMSAKWRLRFKFWKLALIIIPVSLFALWFGTDQARERLQYFATAGVDSVGETSREVGWAAFKSEAITGIGLGGYSENWESFSNNPGEPSSVHAIGSYHELLAETGIVGLALFCATFMTILIWSFRTWRELPFIRLNHEVAYRLKNFSENHPLKRKLRREKGKMPTRKAAVGGLMLGTGALLTYAAFDFSLKLPAILFYLSCMVGTLIAFARGYECRKDSKKIWILAAVMPLGLCVWAGIIGMPRHYSNHLTYISSELLSHLLEDPEQVFQSQGDLNFVESNLRLATELIPDNGKAWVKLGTAGLLHLSAQMESPTLVAERTLPTIERALELNPGSWEAHFDAARALTIIGDRDEDAMEHMIMARKLAPSRIEPVAFLGGLIVMRDPSSEEGRQLLERALSIDSTYAPARSVLRRAELQSGRVVSTDSMLTESSLAEQFTMLPDLPNRVNGAGLPDFN